MCELATNFCGEYFIKSSQKFCIKYLTFVGLLENNIFLNKNHVLYSRTIYKNAPNISLVILWAVVLYTNTSQPSTKVYRL